MSFKINVSISYNDIFNDFEKVSFNDLIKDIPTECSLTIVSHFIAQIHTVEFDPKTQIEQLKFWGQRLPNEVKIKIDNFILSTIQNRKNEFCFLNNASLLILIGKIIENENNIALPQDLTIEQELNLFKAYLYCTQIWLDEQLKGFTKIETKTPKDLIKILLPTQLPYQEIFEFKDFRIQFIKAIYFFKFCEKNEEFRTYLDIFLNQYKLSSWKIYLFNLISMYINVFDRNNTYSSIKICEEKNEITEFLNNLCINKETYSESKDFLKLRERPVYKGKDSKYIFLNLNFLIDKIFQGIQFDFARILVNNSATYKGKLIKKPVDFMSIFSGEFSEKELFYNVIDYAFEKCNYIKLSGEQIKNYIKDGEPDYYIRDNGKIYLFEFKNIFISSEIKNSLDYEKIEAEIFKKLVENQSNSAKGVTQIVNVIEMLLNKNFKVFDDYDFNNIRIYPIIVYVDFTFNLSGINYILNKEFKSILESRRVINSHIIKDITLIDLDSFIKFQDLFRSGKLKLNNCLNEYIAITQLKNDFFKQISTFNMFIHNKTKNYNYDTPEMMMEEVMSILPEDKDIVDGKYGAIS